MLQNFLSVALPIILAFIGTIGLASWSQNKRLDDIIARLGRIEGKQDDRAERIVKLETQASRIRTGR
jgi:hypothetical protein